MQQQEDKFCALLDAAAEYLKTREQLDQLLKAGHLNIARARYALGPGTIGQTSYSSHMQATIRTYIALRDEHPFQLVQHSSSACSAQPAHSSPENGDAADSQASRTAGSEDLDSVDSENGTGHGANRAGQQNGQHAASEYSSSAIAELAAKFDTNHLDSGDSGRTKAAGDPLKWFGFMSPPPLRQAQIDFKKSAELSVQLANVQYKMDKLLSIVSHAESHSEQTSN